MVLPVGDGFVAVGVTGDEAGAWISRDGVTAERVESPELAGEGVQVINRAAIISETELVAVGFERPSSGEDVSAVWASGDAGESWLRLPTDESFTSVDGSHMRGVVAGSDGRVVAGGFDGHDNGVGATTWMSQDGVEWVRSPAEPDGEPFGGEGGQEIATLVEGPNGFVAVGEDESSGDFDAAVWTSPDGIEWTKQDDSPDLGGPNDQRMIYALATPAGIIAVGYEEIGGDANGAVWTSRTGPRGRE